MNNEIKGAVIIIKNSIVDSSFPFKDGEKSENIFLEQCKKSISNFDTYSKNDIETILEQGYEEFGNNGSVCIHWFNWDE